MTGLPTAIGYCLHDQASCFRLFLTGDALVSIPASALWRSSDRSGDRPAHKSRKHAKLVSRR